MFRTVVSVLLTTAIGFAAADVPQYFQTSPELFAGPTATGRAPFLAEINPEFSGPDGKFVPNTPLETAAPIKGNTGNTNIFTLLGNLSPYFPNPRGFGVDEYALPSGSNIDQVHMIHRHGGRYPSVNASVEIFGKALGEAIKNGARFSGELSFLNGWSYGLGQELLLPKGRQELYDSGVLHYYDYGHLYDPSSNIIVRATTQDRILKSAENFLAGFFGLEWPQNATLELIIEQNGFNNSLAGDRNCKNSATGVNAGGTNASVSWQNKYLPAAVQRLNALSGNYTWNVASAYNAQTLCPYETNAFGYSPWCALFTLEEWQGFEYALDLAFVGNDLFQSPTGRALGIGYVDEFLARLQRRYLFSSDTGANTTLDHDASTFPLDQSLYFDFSHYLTIGSAMTAFGLTQFAQFLPASGPPPDQQVITSYFHPYASRLDIEIITAPHPVSPVRKSGQNAYLSGPPTKYVHFLLNQRTIPLGASLADCGKRTDGWCEFDTFLRTQRNAVRDAQYNYACNGDYPAVPYGTITNGVPLANYGS